MLFFCNTLLFEEMADGESHYVAGLELLGSKDPPCLSLPSSCSSHTQLSKIVFECERYSRCTYWWLCCSELPSWDGSTQLRWAGRHVRQHCRHEWRCWCIAIYGSTHPLSTPSVHYSAICTAMAVCAPNVYLFYNFSTFLSACSLKIFKPSCLLLFFKKKTTMQMSLLLHIAAVWLIFFFPLYSKHTFYFKR